MKSGMRIDNHPGMQEETIEPSLARTLNSEIATTNKEIEATRELL